MSVRVEQMTLSELLPNNGGQTLPETFKPTARSKKLKTIELESKFKVTAGGITIYGVVDFFAPSQEDSYWTFVTSDDRKIMATGNVMVESNI